MKGNTQLLVLQNHFHSIKRKPFTGRSVTSALQNWLTCCVYFTDEFCPTISTLLYPVTDTHTHTASAVRIPSQTPKANLMVPGEAVKKKRKEIMQKSCEQIYFPSCSSSTLIKGLPEKAHPDYILSTGYSEHSLPFFGIFHIWKACSSL